MPFNDITQHSLGYFVMRFKESCSCSQILASPEENVSQKHEQKFGLCSGFKILKFSFEFFKEGEMLCIWLHNSLERLRKSPLPYRHNIVTV